MFKGLTKDLTGSADICSAVVEASKLVVSSYLLSHETVLFAFQSAKEEFAFTNEALVLCHGENATTTRKLVERFEFRECAIDDVVFETTGRVDRDCEIKFRIGDRLISIDIARKEEGAVKIYYKALVALSREQQTRRRNWQFVKDGVSNSTKAMKLKGMSHGGLSGGVNTNNGSLTTHADDVLKWTQSGFERLNDRCYKDTIMAVLEGYQ